MFVSVNVHTGASFIDVLTTVLVTSALFPSALTVTVIVVVSVKPEATLFSFGVNVSALNAAK